MGFTSKGKVWLGPVSAHPGLYISAAGAALVSQTTMGLNGKGQFSNSAVGAALAVFNAEQKDVPTIPDGGEAACECKPLTANFDNTVSWDWLHLSYSHTLRAALLSLSLSHDNLFRFVPTFCLLALTTSSWLVSGSERRQTRGINGTA